MSSKILLVDHDQETLETGSAMLTRNGFVTFKARSGQEGLRLAYQHQPDLVLLEADVASPSGWEVCRRLREMSEVPIIFLTACNEAQDVVKGLDMGADDYIVKPVDEYVLLARIRVRMRRSPNDNSNGEVIFGNGDISVNVFTREVIAQGKFQHLTPKEFSLLVVLARNAGRVVTREELVTEAWGEAYDEAVDSLKLYIHYLRKKIEVDPQKPTHILTARGVGYRFSNR